MKLKWWPKTSFGRWRSDGGLAGVLSTRWNVLWICEEDGFTGALWPLIGKECDAHLSATRDAWNGSRLWRVAALMLQRVRCRNHLDMKLPMLSQVHPNRNRRRIFQVYIIYSSNFCVKVARVLDEIVRYLSTCVFLEHRSHCKRWFCQKRHHFCKSPVRGIGYLLLGMSLDGHHRWLEPLL